MVEEITKQEMLELYEKGLVFELVNTGNRIYARTPLGKNAGNRVVWCAV